MTDSVQLLLDIEELKTLKVRYCRFLDAEDWAGFRSLFDDESDFGPDAFLERVIRHHTDAEVVTVHQCFTPELDVAADGTATGIWPMEDFVDRIWRDDGTREAFRGYGYYVESYRKVDGAWKIASLRHERTRVDRLDVSALPPFPHRDQPVTEMTRGSTPA
jgi:hypothetical protein